MPDVLNSYARLLNHLLSEKISLHEALLKLVLTTHTWSLQQMHDLQTSRIPIGTDCPQGSPWQGLKLPDGIFLRQEWAADGAYLGVEVQTVRQIEGKL